MLERAPPLRGGLRLRPGGSAGTCRGPAVSAALAGGAGDAGARLGAEDGRAVSIRLFGPNFLSRVAPSLASPEGPAALMRRCSAWGEKQSCGDSEGNARPVEGGSGGCGMLGAETLGLSHPLPPFFPSRDCPREVHLEQPGLQRDAGGQGPVIGSREGKSEPEEREV